jgi:hypothetical protein
MTRRCPFRYFKTKPEITLLVVAVRLGDGWIPLSPDDIALSE